MPEEDEGISEVASETLIIALVAVLTVITIMLVLGVVPLTEKTAYVAPRFSIANVSDRTVITAFNRGGDAVSFNNSSPARYSADLYVDTDAGSFRAIPDPALTVYQPGDTLVAYYTGSGFVLADTLTGAAFTSLPPGKITVRLTDATSGVLIAKEDLVKGSAAPTPTPAFYPVSVSWEPAGTGKNPGGTITPPGINGGTVGVPAGGSQSFTVTPKTGFRIRFITLDGVEVSGERAIDEAFTVTISNIQENHSLYAVFSK